MKDSEKIKVLRKAVVDGLGLSHDIADKLRCTRDVVDEFQVRAGEIRYDLAALDEPEQAATDSMVCDRCSRRADFFRIANDEFSALKMCLMHFNRYPYPGTFVPPSRRATNNPEPLDGSIEITSPEEASKTVNPRTEICHCGHEIPAPHETCTKCGATALDRVKKKVDPAEVSAFEKAERDGPYTFDSPQDRPYAAYWFNAALDAAAYATNKHANAMGHGYVHYADILALKTEAKA